MGTPDDALSLHVRRDGNATTIVAAGALDLASAAELRTAAYEASDGARDVVLDLRGLTFIDSSGLGTLLNLRGELRREGVGMLVEAEDGAVRRALETTGLGELLTR
jgi:anti-sigma B factor antagonist/stage II sporulation protein AA (anti-sigma F factor antagonist)